MGNLSDYALQFDGSQNYVSLGTMGNFGSNLGSGFYCSFQIQTAQTAIGEVFGELNTSGGTGVFVGLNYTTGGGNTAGQVRVWVRDNGGNVLQAQLATPYNFYDGKIHTFVCTANTSAMTITITIDGNSQSLSYANSGTLSSYSNFNGNMLLGVRNNGGTIQQYLACTLDNFQIGTSSSVLYGSYPGISQLGSGTTLKDVSGQGNNGTLTGSSLPLWTKMADYNIAANANIPQPVIRPSIRTF